jgi:hypothetical protein
MAQGKYFVRVRPERKTKWHRLRANLKNYQRTPSYLVPTEFLIASGHWDLIAHSLGDDLRVLVVWGRSKRERTHVAPCAPRSRMFSEFCKTVVARFVSGCGDSAAKDRNDHVQEQAHLVPSFDEGVELVVRHGLSPFRFEHLSLAFEGSE